MYIYVIVEAFWGGRGGVGNVIVHVLFRPGAISLHTSCDTNLRHICNKFDNHLQQLHEWYS